MEFFDFLRQGAPEKTTELELEGGYFVDPVDTQEYIHCLDEFERKLQGLRYCNQLLLHADISEDVISMLNEILAFDECGITQVRVCDFSADQLLHLKMKLPTSITVIIHLSTEPSDSYQQAIADFCAERGDGNTVVVGSYDSDDIETVSNDSLSDDWDGPSWTSYERFESQDYDAEIEEDDAAVQAVVSQGVNTASLLRSQDSDHDFSSSAEMDPDVPEQGVDLLGFVLNVAGRDYLISGGYDPRISVQSSSQETEEECSTPGTPHFYF